MPLVLTSYRYSLPLADAPEESQALLDRFTTGTGFHKLQGWLKGFDPTPAGREQALRQIDVLIAQIDHRISTQVDAILHCPAVQRLEASWRGLQYLVTCAEGHSHIRVKLLDVRWKELARDVTGAIEFDQSELFHKVYDHEFGMPGGEPFGLLIGDYEIRNTLEDIAGLTGVSQVAAAAFAPFIAAPHPSLLGLTQFTFLERFTLSSSLFESEQFIKWRAFRATEDARFVGLALPRILMRLPHGEAIARHDGFRYVEQTHGSNSDNFLWGNAAYAFAGVVIGAFASSAWPADIRGTRRGPGGIEAGGGLVRGLPVDCFATDALRAGIKSITDICIPDAQEKGFSELGLIPLCQCKGLPYAAFYSTASVQTPRRYVSPLDNANAQMSAGLQHILCASRFAHYLKAIGRDHIGSSAEPTEWQDLLSRWLSTYTTDDARAASEVKAKFPLRQSEIGVRAVPGRPGVLNCEIHLMPHYKLDDLAGTITLRTELAPMRTES